MLCAVLLCVGVFIPSNAQCGVWQFQSCLSWHCIGFLLSDVWCTVTLIAHLNGMCASVMADYKVVILLLTAPKESQIHWCFVVRESSYHERDSIARYMVLDIWYFCFRLVQGHHFKNVSQGCQHTFTQVLLYLPLLERLEDSGMFICFIHTIWQTQKKNKEEKRVLSRILLCACWVFIDNAV